MFGAHLYRRRLFICFLSCTMFFSCSCFGSAGVLHFLKTAANNESLHNSKRFLQCWPGSHDLQRMSFHDIDREGSESWSCDCTGSTYIAGRRHALSLDRTVSHWRRLCSPDITGTSKGNETFVRKGAGNAKVGFSNPVLQLPSLRL